MTVVDECVSATKELVAQLGRDDSAEAAKLMQKIKFLLIQFTVATGTVPRGGSSSTKEQADREVSAAIGALEAFIVHSVKQADESAFARYFAQLRAYYAMTSLKKTPNQPKVLGLNLVRLLVDNQLAEFHSELELVPQECTQSPFIQFPVTLERSLMEGMYNQVLRACKTVPDPLFAEYLGPLEDAVRAEISQCAAASYSDLQLTAAQKLFNFNNREDLVDYIEINEDWKVDGDRLVFPEKEEKRLGPDDIPSRGTIRDVLSFAARLERIV